MKISFITPEFITEENYDGGLSNYLAKVGLGLTRLGHEVTIIVRSHTDEQLHSALGYVAPRQNWKVATKKILKERAGKLEAARKTRKQKQRQEKLWPAQHHRAPGSCIHLRG